MFGPVIKGTKVTLRPPVDGLKSGSFMDNEPSKRALRKAGYRQVGVFREDFWRDGRWHDHWEAEILRSDWEEQHTG